MSQSRKGSLTEAVANVVAGYGVALLIQALLFPAFGLGVTTAQSLQIAAVFTLASIARSYVLRRLFTRLAGAAADHRDGEPAPASQDPGGRVGNRGPCDFGTGVGRSSFTAAILPTGYPPRRDCVNPNECGIFRHRAGAQTGETVDKLRRRNGGGQRNED